MKEDLSVKIVHKANSSELINKNPEFAMFSMLNIIESDAIRWEMEGETAYCIQVMFIGKTGYGKSTTLNKICGQELFKTDDINSCTKTLFSAEYNIHNQKNYFLSLCDLPGIGESMATDYVYTKKYTEMLLKSHCVVYVTRADQRDYSKDIEILSPMLEDEEHRRKIMLAVNFIDKIEPVSRTSTFKLNSQQEANVERKLSDLQRIFNITKENIHFYSASEEYNLDKIVKAIVNILRKSVKTGSNISLEEAIAREGITGNSNLDSILGKFLAIPLRNIYGDEK